MSDKTGIEWTDATWNPVTGCTRVSAGCDNCYAATLANRLLRSAYTSRLPVVDTDANREDPFAVRIWPDRLRQPAAWTESRFVFVNSMSDLFHADIPSSFVRRVFETMLENPQHVYQVLTKRPGRAAAFWRKHSDLFGGGALPWHIWIGTSVENQDAVFRVRQLRKVPAEVRFVSCEPLIGPVKIDLSGLQWLIVGGESGPVRRRMDLTWAVALRDACIRKGVPFFFKQVGGRTPKAGGRLLEGRTWDEMPMRPQTKKAATG